MIYILFGAITVFTFNIVVYLAIGAETFWTAPWVDHVSLGIIGAGVAVSALSALRCNLCRSLGYRWLLCAGSCRW